MPSNKSLVLIAFLALLGWLASTSLFVVSEQQSGIQRRFDHVIDGNLMPGLHVKLPVVDKVSLFDKRVHSSVLEGYPFTLPSGENILLDVVATWRIVLPERYDSARQGDDSKVVNELMQQVAAQLTERMSHLTLADLSTSRQDQALQVARIALDAHVQETLGVSVTGMSFRRIALPEAQQAAIEQKMKTMWEHQADVIAANAADQAAQIRADGERHKAMTLAAAHENAESMKSAADTDVATRYNDVFTRNPAFFRFYYGLKTWQESMQHGKGVLVLGPDEDLMRWIKAGR